MESGTSVSVSPGSRSGLSMTMPGAGEPPLKRWATAPPQSSMCQVRLVLPSKTTWMSMARVSNLYWMRKGPFKSHSFSIENHETFHKSSPNDSSKNVNVGLLYPTFSPQCLQLGFQERMEFHQNLAVLLWLFLQTYWPLWQSFQDQSEPVKNEIQHIISST